MTKPGADLVDPAVTRWHHFVTRCVRRGFLLSEGSVNRREWIEQRLQELASMRGVRRRILGDGQPLMRTPSQAPPPIAPTDPPVNSRGLQALGTTSSCEFNVVLVNRS